ncbi:MAG: hypothetical protein HY785_16345 [Oscillatoriophycideae cyanobacterium NC_groundwater_1537_Pr4_S-0.65um_50_18]|nr:hypothetical protein [Oscillatoriophycideae cyanobacterium NC_groundwater_1537_Pr4_S-0.65um_50_18]
MSERVEAIKQVYGQQLKAHYLAQYKAYCQEQETGDRYDLGRENRVSDEAASDLPSAVSALQQQALDRGDSYYANVYQLPVDQQLTYAVRITTDGDDGWLAVFDPQGQLLAFAQTYLEIAVWAEAQSLQLDCLDFFEETLPGFEAAKAQTLWGKPLSEIDPLTDSE